MEKLIYTNSQGDSVTLGVDKPYVLVAIEGVGGSKTDVQMTKAAFQDGKTYIDTLFEPRDLNIEVDIWTESQEEMFEKRSELVRVFNAKLGVGTLRYEYDGGSKEIEAITEVAPIFPTGTNNKGIGYQKTSITLSCPSPFWMDIFTESEEIADWIGGLSFPLMLPMTFEGRSSLTNRVINNVGNVEAPITFKFYGAATNPKVINVDTGEFIKVNRTIEANEVLTIDTTFGKKKVTLKNLDTGIETNAFGYLDLESTFFQLTPGDNTFTYTADSGLQNARVRISWRNRYVGV